MRIVAITSSYPIAGQPTASPFLLDWAASLVARDHSVHVITPAATGGAVTSAHRGVVVEAIDYMPMRSWQTLAYGAGMFENVQQNPLRLAQVPPLLAAMYRHAVRQASKADMLHAHWLFPSGLVAAWVHRSIGCPLVVTVHSTDFHILRALPGGRMLARFIAAECDALHFVADYLRRAFVAWLGNPAMLEGKTFVTPMGMSDEMAWSPVSSLAKHPSSFGFIGRLVPIKGVDALLHACAEVRPHRLVIAGNGPERHRLQRLADALSLPHVFLGSVSGAAKLEFFAKADVVVFPSRIDASGRTEGVPVAVLEALGRGRVVVAAAVGGIPEVIQHQHSGYLFEPGSVEDLIRVLREVLTNWPSAVRVAAAGRHRGSRLIASRLSALHEIMYLQALQRAAA